MISSPLEVFCTYNTNVGQNIFFIIIKVTSIGTAKYEDKSDKIFKTAKYRCKSEV